MLCHYICILCKIEELLHTSYQSFVCFNRLLFRSIYIAKPKVALSRLDLYNKIKILFAVFFLPFHLLRQFKTHTGNYTFVPHIANKQGQSNGKNILLAQRNNAGLDSGLKDKTYCKQFADNQAPLTLHLLGRSCRMIITVHLFYVSDLHIPWSYSDYAHMVL